MLLQAEKPTNDFTALARYLVNGRTQPPDPKRVAWLIARNLPTDDPQRAAILMAATAELSQRCKNACYHAIIAWAEHERPTPDTMQEIARKALELAGLGEHQALVMGHGDRHHPHLHMMINRVHPDTGRAWSTSHDHRRWDRIMRALADAQGFQYVPAHAFNPELTDDLPKKPDSNATYAAKRGARTNRLQGSNAAARDLGARLSEHFDRATTWEDIEIALAEYGYQLEAKGSGLVVGNSSGYVRFSRLGLTLTANDLGKRFGRPFAEDDVRRFRRTPRRFSLVERKALSERLGPLFAHAASWTYLMSELHELGLNLQSRGQGLVITDGRRQMHLRDIDPLLSHADLANRLGPPWVAHVTGVSGPPTHVTPNRPALRVPPSRKPVWSRPPVAPRFSAPLPASKGKPRSPILTVDAVDIARAIGTRDELRGAVQEAKGKRKAWLAKAPLIAQLMDELKETWKASSSLRQPRSRSQHRPPGQRPARRSRRSER